jgi:hypothetical protein
MDYVVNHWGIEHWMMKDLNRLHQFENYTQTDIKRSIISNASK